MEFKHTQCNVCGGTLVQQGNKYVCPYCDAVYETDISQEETILLTQASAELQRQNFADAEELYENIAKKYPNNDQAYWGIVCCRYGIKYEQDYNGKMIPTCCMPTIESFSKDKNFVKAVSLATDEKATWYKQQAEYIDRVRQTWIDHAKNESEYDVFICYKDTDLANGVARTQDSIDAFELYSHLRDKGYRVFYSRESLRTKIGEKYEPYIFQALQTAKVMIVYGSSSEYITSTWLKNEWMRYLRLIKDGKKQPNSLIVAYSGDNIGGLPKVFLSLQILDASKNNRNFYTDIDNCLKKQFNSQSESKPKGGLVCPNCGGNFSASDLLDGDDEITCLNCGKVFSVKSILPKDIKKRLDLRGNSSQFTIDNVTNPEDISRISVPTNEDDLIDFLYHSMSMVNISAYGFGMFKYSKELRQENEMWKNKVDEAYSKYCTRFGKSKKLRSVRSKYESFGQQIQRRKAGPITLSIIVASILIICFAIWGISAAFKGTKAKEEAKYIDLLPTCVEPLTDNQYLNVNAEYGYKSDTLTFYYAKCVSETRLKIECWKRKDNETITYEWKRDVCTIDIENEDISFSWVDNDKTAFVMRLIDENSSTFDDEGKIVCFSINLGNGSDNKGTNIGDTIRCYKYTSGEDEVYLATLLNDNFIKIEKWGYDEKKRWIFFSEDIFSYYYDLRIINISTEDAEFSWNNAEKTSFTINMYDPFDYWDKEKSKNITFEVLTTDYQYDNSLEYLCGQ